MPTKSNNTGGRGGARPGAGRKKKPLTEKVEAGNPGGRTLKILDIPDVSGVEMPKPHDFLSATQRDGRQLQAKEIYEETWNWLKSIGCTAVVSPQLLELLRHVRRPLGFSVEEMTKAPSVTCPSTPQLANRFRPPSSTSASTT